MGEWQTVKLSEICNIRYGKDHKKLNDGNIPVYGSGGLMRYVDKAIHNSKSVLIPRKGSLKNLFFVEPPFWTVDTLFWTDINTDVIYPEFLYYQLKTLNLETYNVGTAVPSLTTAVLNDILLVLPDLEEQKIIANYLVMLDNKIELNNKINNNLAA
ncbi:MAG: restriction endonuclease subunit S [Oscillospiraceae bacterium]